MLRAFCVVGVLAVTMGELPVLLPASVLVGELGEPAAPITEALEKARTEGNDDLSLSRSGAAAISFLRAAAFASAFAPINPFNRQEAATLFLKMIDVTKFPNKNWNGDIPSCLPGDVPNEFTVKTVEKINYYRAHAGLPSLRHDPAYNQACSQVAVTLSKARKLSHSVTPDWPCWTLQGSSAAARSNIQLGAAGPLGIDLYMDDFGDINIHAGHRRWFLYPPLDRVGYGAAIPTNGVYSSADAILVQVDNVLDLQRPSNEPSFVAFPCGYTPWQMMPRSGRWSLSMSKADFSISRVSVYCNGVVVPTTIESVNQLYGDPGIVFRLANAMADPPTKGNENFCIAKVSNVKVNNIPRDISFNVTVTDPIPSGQSCRKLAVSTDTGSLSYLRANFNYVQDFDGHPAYQHESMPQVKLYFNNDDRRWMFGAGLGDSAYYATQAEYNFENKPQQIAGSWQAWDFSASPVAAIYAKIQISCSDTIPASQPTTAPTQPRTSISKPITSATTSTTKSTPKPNKSNNAMVSNTTDSNTTDSVTTTTVTVATPKAITIASPTPTTVPSCDCAPRGKYLAESFASSHHVVKATVKSVRLRSNNDMQVVLQIQSVFKSCETLSVEEQLVVTMPRSCSFSLSTRVKYLFFIRNVPEIGLVIRKCESNARFSAFNSADLTSLANQFSACVST